MVLKLSILTNWDVYNIAGEVHSQSVHGCESGFRVTKHDIGPGINLRPTKELSLCESWNMLWHSDFDLTFTRVDVEI